MGIFRCHGCDKSFCVRHTMEHRVPLDEALAILIRKNEALETNVDSNMLRNEGQRLMMQINAWEKESMEKVEHAAEEARQQVSDMVSVSGTSQLKQILVCRDEFTERLHQAANNKDFHERHLEYWTQFYEDLQVNFTSLRTSYAQLVQCKLPFITKIVVHETTAEIHFTKWCYYQRKCVDFTDIRRSNQQTGCNGFAPIQPCDGSYSSITVPDIEHTPPPARPPYHPPSPREVVPHTPIPHRPQPVRNARQVESGEYRFRLNTDRFFIGIISKCGDTRTDSLNTHSVYGWTGDNTVYIDGVPERGYRGYQSDIQMGNTVALLVDCEQRVIRLKNLTTNRTYELAVAAEKCPLPWLLNLRFVDQDG
jgi:hypothetical protein